MKSKIDWYTAFPVWEYALKDAKNKRIREPLLLRFDSDDFMEEMETLLKSQNGSKQQSSKSLADHAVRFETWQEETAGWSPDDTPPSLNTIPKLYHPVHGRFYLVAASLVCIPSMVRKIEDLPDKPVNTANSEKVFFVIRRLFPLEGAEFDPCNQATYSTCAWINNGNGGCWRPTLNDLDENEERLPMFAMNCAGKSRDHKIWVGYIPTGQYENRLAPPDPGILSEDAVGDDPLADPRLFYFKNEILGGIQDISGDDELTGTAAFRAFVNTLLEFAQFIDNHAGGNWDAVDELNETLKAILQKVYEKKNEIQSGELIDPAQIHASLPSEPSHNDIENLIIQLGLLDENLTEDLTASVKSALTMDIETYKESQKIKVPHCDQSAEAFYTIHCIYERPNCKEIVPNIISNTSPPFRFASFFDPDAPVRPITIRMPVDTSVEGFKKFPKGVSILISKNLRKQMDRVKNIKLADLDDGEVPSEDANLNLGMICSLSIPIITICALILLMIIVQLLNIVFWWLPFFRICFPLKLSK